MSQTDSIRVLWNENSVPNRAIRNSLYLFQIVKRFQVRQCCRVIVLIEAKNCHITDHFEHICRKVRGMEGWKRKPPPTLCRWGAEKRDIEKSEPSRSHHGLSNANPMPRKRNPPLTSPAKGQRSAKKTAAAIYASWHHQTSRARVNPS